MKVLFCASEVTPFAKTGGLADVAGSLPLALGKLGIEVVIMMPRYRGLKGSKKKLSENVQVHFIENEAYFNRSSLYGNEGGDYADNLQRFSFFSNQVLALAKEIGFKPDLIHAHDWQTALVPVILKRKLSQDPFFKKTKSLLTVHNLAYQGHFPERLFPELGLDSDLFSTEAFEFHGKINLLKAGLVYADALNTVSPTYAKEVRTKEFGFGLEGVIQQRQKSFRGILNGIDDDYWNPAKDKLIKKNFSGTNLKGKEACKADLQAHCRLKVDASIPLFGIVSRLAQQKGMNLLAETADTFLSKKLQFVLLGDGDSVYERTFKNIGARHSKNAAVYVGFNAAEAHSIYAGSDFFLMPSVYEPCGLGQLISLRYGTLPVVRHTGGLVDTIVDVDQDPKKGNGFVFADHSPSKFLQVLDRAIGVFENKKRLNALRHHAMNADFSWEHSAKEYKKFYKEIISQ